MSKADGQNPAPDDRDAQTWVARYGDLVRFVAMHESMPREQPGEGISTRAEALLGGWVRYQRRRFSRGNLPGWQRALLEQIDQFSFDPHADLWWDQYKLLSNFQAAHRGLPRYRSGDRDEKALGAWVHKQRHLHRSGELSAERVSALRELPIKIV
jgi:Helicase associated domain